MLPLPYEVPVNGGTHKVDQKNIVIALVMGLAAGWLASWVPFTGGDGGLLQYLVSGVLGSFVGSAVLQRANMNLGIQNEIGRDIATATIGAVIVMVIANILT
jgi:uncharacterized membrane protein YeaQ/YmgE (transglycosylase-associated protein family)